ncbi:AbrB/MazE/SpoVT family DNA-binding domain-containing protein [Ideonella azotifigens]|uniref:SpoVT-AbrB domain-containing protein n=1 Tax=Ideonella azotifigens TaxID=513160 RepID=A0ABP3VYK4_9BURK|nr:AbrB/MazE/SpoVT family DNA-binding domain-containing protein [Ideonella azotifigens]MCD2339292.1 AbrB/MazE/SpoVT family DNA-binding domain-containing protein [Ideonella azotifigens]
MTHRTITVTHWKQANKTVNQFTSWRRPPPTACVASRRLPAGWIWRHAGSKGQVVLPADMRRRLGLNPGARLEVTEEADGLRLRVQRAVPQGAV